ncbi:hypothetical protein [Parasediminibacterium sp. JCM 36343]|uniref:hypothetical protein n=1 Tax=Parasediminibacterium sp. JCM 36343 TaxID=3374279 RepID=UPI00397A613C
MKALVGQVIFYKKLCFYWNRYFINTINDYFSIKLLIVGKVKGQITKGIGVAPLKSATKNSFLLKKHANEIKPKPKNYLRIRTLLTNIEGCLSDTILEGRNGSL